MNLQTKIRQIVHAHSGGVKLIELMTELIAENYKHNEQVVSDDDIMLCVEADPTLNAYGYVWNMGGSYAEGVHREKTFVHQV